MLAIGTPLSFSICDVMMQDPGLYPLCVTLCYSVLLCDGSDGGNVRLFADNGIWRVTNREAQKYWQLIQFIQM